MVGIDDEWSEARISGPYHGVGIDIEGIQSPHEVDGLLIVVDAGALFDHFKACAGSGEDHIVGEGAGECGHSVGPTQSRNESRGILLFGIDDSVSIGSKEFICPS